MGRAVSRLVVILVLVIYLYSRIASPNISSVQLEHNVQMEAVTRYEYISLDNRSYLFVENMGRIPLGIGNCTVIDENVCFVRAGNSCTIYSSTWLGFKRVEALYKCW